MDSESASQVFDALRAINQAFGTTIIIVTHDPMVASRVDRVVAIRDGRTSTEIHRRKDEKNGVLQEQEGKALTFTLGVLCCRELTMGTHIWMMERQHNILFGNVGF